MKRNTICVISSCKIRQNTSPFDADYRVKWRCLEYRLSSTLKALYLW